MPSIPGPLPPGQREAARGSYQPSAFSLNQDQTHRRQRRYPGDFESCPYECNNGATRARCPRSQGTTVSGIYAILRACPFRYTSHPPGGGDGGFSVLIRTAQKQSESNWVLRPRSLVCATEVVHGKTGPAPSGAVLFGPFSWAYKKKDEEKIEVCGRG